VISLQSYDLSTGSKWPNALNTNSFYLSTKSSQPPNLHIYITSPLFNLLAALILQSSSLVTLVRLPTSSSLRITDRSFLYASPCLWNQIPSSLSQPHPSPSVSRLPESAIPHFTLSTHHCHHPYLPHSSSPGSKPTSFTNLSHRRLFFWPQNWLHGLYDWTVSSQHLYFCFFKFSSFAICYRPSVCLSVSLSSVCLYVVCLSSVTFVRPTQAVQIFGNISTALGTLAIRWHTLKISRRSSQRNPSSGRVKHEG